jgi:hypothetical protein
MKAVMDSLISNREDQAWWNISLILATWDEKIEELCLEAILHKKLARPYLKNKQGMVVHTCGASFSASRSRSKTSL